MASGSTDTSQLIRKLSRRQWMVSLAMVGLALGSLFFGWHGIMNDEQSAAIVNLAGRQRMLSQRMAMYVVLQQYETDPQTRREYRGVAVATAAEFERAHETLAAIARALDENSAIHALYFGPDGNVDADSRRYLALVRTVIQAHVLARPIDARSATGMVAAAGSSLIRKLDEVTQLYPRGSERQDAFVLRLMQISTLLMVALAAFGMFRVFRPTIQRLSEDVAGRDRAQRELKESEERFKAFSESSSDWFWQTDGQHRFSWTQDGRNVHTPLPLGQVQGRTRHDLRADVETAAVEKWQGHQADLDAHRPFRDFEYQIGAGDQPLRWISVSGQPYFDGHGNFLGYRGTAKYIQLQKDAEASNLRLQLAIEQSPVSILIIDADARIIYANAHFCAVSGYSADEAMGRRPKSLLCSGITPDSVFAAMATALAAGESWRGELCCRKKNGELYWENLSVSTVNNHLGVVTHYVAVSEDITAHKKTRRLEQNRNRILETIANGAPLPQPLELMVAMAEAELPGAICAIQSGAHGTGKRYRAGGSPLSAALLDAVEELAGGAGVGAGATAALAANRVVLADIEQPPYWEAGRELAAAEGLRACWAQPVLSSAGRLLGTLAVCYRSPRAPAADDIQVIDLIASLAAICLERNEAEQTLRQQEEQARSLLAEHETILGNALVGIVYLKHRRVVSCNRRLEEIFGYGPGELIGASSECFYDSHETFAAIGEQAYRVLADNRNYNIELTLKHKNGSLFRGALNGCAIDPAQPNEGSIWVYADISERYRAEQEVHKLLQAVEQSPVSIFITDRDGLIEYVNPRFTQVTGYSSDEVLGQNPRLLQSGETPRATYRELWQTILAGREWRGVVRNRRKNGELFWEEASISPIRNEQGETTHFVAVKEDVTARKQIEDELGQHRAHLEDLVQQRTADLSAALTAAKVADQAKDAFLAHVSHELRTPLNAVIGLSELARRVGNDPRQQDYLDKIAGAGRSLAAIINDLLDLSKISASRMEFENISFSLRGLIQRSRSVMAHRAAEKGLALIERIDAEVPDVLLGDPLRIEQILLNLLSNAIKFTAVGRVELRIGLSVREGSRVCLGIEVEDTGIGLAAETIARLFQPFAQADASINRKFGGTGLGLALCKRLAEMMDGDIGVSSREGGGTTFQARIWLSLGQAADLPEAEQSATRQALPVRYRDAHVLVVDDQPLNREIVEALLAEIGIAPRCAGNGQEALDILSEAGPDAFDLVLMDIQMPVVDGLTATRVIRKLDGFAPLPIIAMTAHTMEHEKEISRAAGMNDHIGKPFETTQFFRLLARWIPAAKQQLAADPPAVPPPPAAAGLAALRSIDTEAGLARFVGNEARYRHWLNEFLGEAPDYAMQIRRLLAGGQVQAARQAAHSIKGRLGMLGMHGLYPLAAALETALIDGAPHDELLDQLQGAAELLCQEIEAGLGAVAPPPPAASDAQPRPAGPPPEAVAQFIVMLRRGDGGSAAAIERCLAELKDSYWTSRLRQTLVPLRNFDFDAACRLLGADDSDADGID